MPSPASSRIGGRIPEAGEIIEGLASIVLPVGAFALFAERNWAWAAVTVAHAVALAGVLWGMVAVAAGRGPHTPLNDTYHRVMVVLLAAK